MIETSKIEVEKPEHCFELKEIGLLKCFLIYGDEKIVLQWPDGQIDLTDVEKRNFIFHKKEQSVITLIDSENGSVLDITHEQIEIIQELIDTHITNKIWPDS